jgi:hypothetical protein
MREFTLRVVAGMSRNRSLALDYSLLRRAAYAVMDNASELAILQNIHRSHGGVGGRRAGRE